MMPRPPLCSALALALGALAGCGGDGQGDYGQALARETGSYAIVDLDSHAVSFASEVPDLAANPVYRRSQMVFRRVPRPGGGPVLMAVFPLTQGQWLRLAGTRPWTEVPDGVCSSAAQSDDHPAYNLDYVTVASTLVGTAFSGLRLDMPSDDEWTAACGVASGWWWGPDATQSALDANAVVRESSISSDRLAAGHGMDNGGPSAVASKAPNPLGFYDMLGNVWVWTQQGAHVRGGSWFDPAATCRAEVMAGTTAGLDQEVDHALIGARLVLRP